MASVVRTGVIRGCNLIQNALFSNSEHTSRALVQYQITRGRRRTTKPAQWFTPKGKSQWNHKELTEENKGFLQEVVEDHYQNRVANSPLRDGPWERNPYQFSTMRTGVLAVKIGVLPQWTKDGRKFHTTLLQVLDNHVIRYTPPEKFATSAGYKAKWKPGRYGSLVVGALSCSPHQYGKQYNNLFAEAGVPPKRKLTRFIITDDAAVQPGTPLYATHFQVGDYVDVQAKTIGHGFQGVVKRWGMKGGPASHGTTKWHRRVGNIGGGRNKAAVWKGKKMPGHMGMDWRILKGLKIWQINTKYNILYVTGPCLPGPTHCYVRIYDSSLKHRKHAALKAPPPMPTHYPEDSDAPLPEQLVDDDLFQFTEPTITFEEQKAK